MCATRAKGPLKEADIDDDLDEAAGESSSKVEEVVASGFELVKCS